MEKEAVTEQSGTLKTADTRLLATLWQELAEAPADAAMHHCLTQLADHVGASNATWVAASRDGALAAGKRDPLC